MAYIGRGINNISNAAILDVITFTDSAGPYNLLQTSLAFTPISAQALVISVDGVIQSPSTYTISAATITFDSVMAASSTNNFIVHNGVGLITEPSDSTVTTAKLADLSVTAGKLAATQDLSTKTITLPASVSGLGTGITNTQLAGSIDVTTKITGVVPTANLGSGTASSSTYLAGDQTYKEIVAIDIAWQAVTTAATLTAVAGKGYPIDTTSNICTVTLPGSASVGDTIAIVDYAGTFNTNNITLTSSLKIEGETVNKLLTTDREGVAITYADVTQGWVATSGVNSGTRALDPEPYSVDFLVIAGGASGGKDSGGGGGAGGYRNSYSSEASGGGGSSETSLTLTPEVVYTIAVGAGGVGISVIETKGNNGADSSISGTGITTITSIGGGGGGSNGNTAHVTINPGADGGSGGGGGMTSGGGTRAGGSGTANQGYDGGTSEGGSYPARKGGGGGGASAVGVAATETVAGNGGDGLASSITGSPVTRAGGGGGGGAGSSGTAGSGGSGGGGAGQVTSGADGIAGTINTGSGGGAGGDAVASSGAGGSGVVILRMADVSYSGTYTGSPTIATGVSGDTVLTFTGDGSYTA